MERIFPLKAPMFESSDYWGYDSISWLNAVVVEMANIKGATKRIRERRIYSYLRDVKRDFNRHGVWLPERLSCESPEQYLKAIRIRVIQILDKMENPPQYDGEGLFRVVRRKRGRPKRVTGRRLPGTMRFVAD